MTKEYEKENENMQEEQDNQKEQRAEGHWEPVAKLDPYEDAPEEVKRYHKVYIKLWDIKEHR